MKRIIVFIVLSLNCLITNAMQPAQLIRNASHEIAEAASKKLANIEYRDYATIEISKIQKLLNQGANPNVTTTKGKSVTPLVFALASGRKDIVEALLKAGASIDIAFMTIARPSVFEDVFSELIRMGANVNQKYSNGATPLMIAAATTMGVEIANRRAEILIKNNADLDVVNANGDTALMLAVKYENADLVAILLQYGADVTIKNKLGKTALDIARESGKENIMKIFSAYKPKIREKL